MKNKKETKLAILADDREENLKTITTELTSAKYLELYEDFRQLTPEAKEKLLFAMTLQNTPPAWISVIKDKNKTIPYIKHFIARRLLNLFFGMGNWTIEFLKDRFFEDDKTYQSGFYGYLVLTWFDGSIRKIPTAGSGKMYRNNVFTGIGDDMKSAISDMTKKGMANMGFFSDIYGAFENEETVASDEGKPKYSYQQLKGLTEGLLKDYLEGVDVKERIIKAKGVLQKAGFNDLLLIVIQMENGEITGES